MGLYKMTERISCDNEFKSSNRIKIREWIKTKFKKSKINELKVLCCPGWEALEIYEIWDELGIKRSNIWAITNEEFDRDKLMGIEGINIIYGDLSNTEFPMEIANQTKFLFDVIYIDLYSNFQKELIEAIIHGLSILLCKPHGVFGITLMLSREKDLYFKNMCWMQGFNTSDDIKLTNILVIIIHCNLSLDIKLLRKIERSITYDEKINLTKEEKEIINDAKVCAKGVTSIFKSKYISGSVPMGTMMVKFKPIRKYGIGVLAFKKAMSISVSILNKTPIQRINEEKEITVYDYDIRKETEFILYSFDNIIKIGEEFDNELKSHILRRISQSLLMMILMGHDIKAHELLFKYQEIYGEDESNLLFDLIMEDLEGLYQFACVYYDGNIPCTSIEESNDGTWYTLGRFIKFKINDGELTESEVILWSEFEAMKKDLEETNIQVNPIEKYKFISGRKPRRKNIYTLDKSLESSIMFDTDIGEINYKGGEIMGNYRSKDDIIRLKNYVVDCITTDPKTKGLTISDIVEELEELEKSNPESDSNTYYTLVRWVFDWFMNIGGLTKNTSNKRKHTWEKTDKFEDTIDEVKKIISNKSRSITNSIKNNDNNLGGKPEGNSEGNSEDTVSDLREEILDLDAFQELNLKQKLDLFDFDTEELGELIFDYIDLLRKGSPQESAELKIYRERNNDLIYENQTISSESAQLKRINEKLKEENEKLKEENLQVQVLKEQLEQAEEKVKSAMALVEKANIKNKRKKRTLSGLGEMKQAITKYQNNI